MLQWRWNTFVEAYLASRLELEKHVDFLTWSDHEGDIFLFLICGQVCRLKINFLCDDPVVLFNRIVHPPQLLSSSRREQVSIWIIYFHGDLLNVDRVIDEW